MDSHPPEIQCPLGLVCPYPLIALETPKNTNNYKNIEEHTHKSVCAINDSLEHILKASIKEAEKHKAPAPDSPRLFSERLDAAWLRFRAEYPPSRVRDDDRAAFDRAVRSDADIEILFRNLESYKQTGEWERGAVFNATNYFNRNIWRETHVPLHQRNTDRFGNCPRCGAGPEFCRCKRE